MREDRRGFLRRAAAAAGVLAAAGELAPSGLATPGAAASAALALLLSVERLKAAFYADTVERGYVFGEELAFADASRTHDEAHAEALADALAALGAPFPPRRTYGFRGVTTDRTRFLQVAEALESTSVAAYVWQAGELADAALRRRLASILGVEAGQLAWARELLAPATRPTAVPIAFAPALDAAQVTAIVDSTGFVRPG